MTILLTSMTALPHLLTSLAAFVAIAFLLYRYAVDCVRQAQEDEALDWSERLIETEFHYTIHNRDFLYQHRCRAEAERAKEETTARLRAEVAA